jgi:plastocyanin
MIGTLGRFAGRGIILAGVALILVLALAPVALAAQHAVSIAGFAFAPDSVTVKVGDSVKWTNNDGTTHTATADDGSWDTGNISGGSSASVTFAKAGTFAYHCAIHRTMQGTVVVEAAAASGRPPTPRPTAGTPPPTDIAPAGSTSDGARSATAALVLAAAAMLGFVIARRRFLARR